MEQTTLAEQIETEYGRTEGKRRGWAIVLSISMGILLILTLDGPRIGPEGLSDSVTYSSLWKAGTCLVLGLLSIGFLRRTDPARRLRLGRPPSVQSLGEGLLPKAPGTFFPVEGGWQFRAPLFPRLSGSKLDIFFVAYFTSVTTGLLMPLPAVLFALIAMALTTSTRAVPIADIRSITRNRGSVAVLHRNANLPFPIVLRCSKGQWERLRATLPETVPVEDIE